MTFRPRRSVLYMPGSNARAIEKARTLAGRRRDPRSGGRGGARRQGAGAPAGRRRREGRRLRRPRGVHPGQRHRHALARRRSQRRRPCRAGRASWCRRSARSRQLERVGQRLLDMKTDLKTRIWAMIETPEAIFNINALAAEAHDSETRLAGFVMGTNDLAKETRARLVPGRAPMVSWLARCMLAAHAHGIDILDGVYNDLSDAEGLRGRMRAGPRHGLRRQDADPSEPDRAVQHGVLAERRRGRAGAQDSSPRSTCRRTRTRAWCRSTAAWSSACTPRWRGARSRSPMRSRRKAAAARPDAWETCEVVRGVVARDQQEDRPCPIFARTSASSPRSPR